MDLINNIVYSWFYILHIKLSRKQGRILFQLYGSMMNLNKVQRTAAEINSKHALIRAGPVPEKPQPLSTGKGDTS